MSDLFSAPALSAGVALIAFVVSIASARSSSRNRHTAFVIYDKQQFDRLQEKRAEILAQQLLTRAGANEGAGVQGAWSNERIEQEARLLFERFWNLQEAEFIGWYRGQLPTTVYRHWLATMQVELKHPSPTWTFGSAGITLSKSLDEAREDWNKAARYESSVPYIKKLLRLMDELECGVDLTENSLARKYGPGMAARIARKIFDSW